MENNPLVSVIVPVYNSEKYLEECLNSLKLQTYDNLEFICVNDGSADGSLEILNMFKEVDDRFVIIDKEHAGVSCARNEGLKFAKGEYISFADSDDRVSLSLYKKFSEVKNKPDIFIFNAVKFGMVSDDIFPQYLFNPSEWKNHKDENTVHVFDDCINPFHGNLTACNKIYSSRLIKSLGENPFPAGLVYEDQYFFFLAMLAAKSIKINHNPMYYYRSNAASVSNNLSEKTFDIFVITDMIEALLEERGIQENYKYALFQYKYKRFASELFNTAENLREDYYKEMQARLKVYENANFNMQFCERLTLFGMYKNVLSLDCKTFFEKYYGKIS